jgi:hypothetical protein
MTHDRNRRFDLSELAALAATCGKCYLEPSWPMRSWWADFNKEKPTAIQTLAQNVFCLAKNDADGSAPVARVATNKKREIVTVNWELNCSRRPCL